jgi:hypothetical protein
MSSSGDRSPLPAVAARMLAAAATDTYSGALSWLKMGRSMRKKQLPSRFWLKKAVDEECKFDHLSTAGGYLAAAWLHELDE